MQYKTVNIGRVSRQSRSNSELNDNELSELEPELMESDSKYMRDLADLMCSSCDTQILLEHSQLLGSLGLRRSPFDETSDENKDLCKVLDDDVASEKLIKVHNSLEKFKKLSCLTPYAALKSGKFWSYDDNEVPDEALLDISLSTCFEEQSDSANQDLCTDFLSEPSHESVIANKDLRLKTLKIRKWPTNKEDFDKIYLTYDVAAKISPEADFQKRLRRILGKDSPPSPKSAKSPRCGRTTRKASPKAAAQHNASTKETNVGLAPRKGKKGKQERPLKKTIVSLHKAVQAYPKNSEMMGSTCSLVINDDSRRADHIDDILFTEWRQLEPEWTAFHIDEAIVKKQIFDSIFQKVLTQTVDEYKRTVKHMSDSSFMNRLN